MNIIMIISISIKEDIMDTEEGVSTETTALQQSKDKEKWWQKKTAFSLRLFTFMLYLALAVDNYFMTAQTAQTSAHYSLYVTPPNIFFFIWTILSINIGLMILYDVMMDEWPCGVHIPLNISNALLIAWIYVFNIGEDFGVFLGALLLGLNVIVTQVGWMMMGWAKQYSFFTYVCRNVFAFYIGWLVAVVNFNLGVVLVYWWGASNKTQVLMFWALAPFTALTITSFNTVYEGRKGLLCSFCLWASVIWALTGAAIKTLRCFDNPTLCQPPQ